MLHTVKNRRSTSVSSVVWSNVWREGEYAESKRVSAISNGERLQFLAPIWQGLSNGWVWLTLCRLTSAALLGSLAMRTSVECDDCRVLQLPDYWAVKLWLSPEGLPALWVLLCPLFLKFHVDLAAPFTVSWLQYTLKQDHVDNIAQDDQMPGKLINIGNYPMWRTLYCSK